MDFIQRNNVLGKPEGMTDEQCYGLPVHHYVTADNLPAIISCWKLTKEDLETIRETHTVWVNTLGQTLAPFSLQTEDPFDNGKPRVSRVAEERYEELFQRLPKEIFDRVHEDIGAASMCWGNPEKAGIFRSEVAAKLAFELCRFIADQIDEAKKLSTTKPKLHVTE